MKTIDYEKHSSLSKNSFWGVWSYLMVGKYIKDTCSLVWNTLFAIILLPFWIFPGAIINLKWNDQFTIPFWALSGLNSVFVIVGYLTMFKVYPQAFFLFYYLVGFVVILVFVGIVLLIIVGSAAFENWSEERKCKEKKMNVLKTFFIDLKKKHCSLIHWSDEK